MVPASLENGLLTNATWYTNDTIGDALHQMVTETDKGGERFPVQAFADTSPAALSVCSRALAPFPRARRTVAVFAWDWLLAEVVMVPHIIIESIRWRISLGVWPLLLVLGVFLGYDVIIPIFWLLIIARGVLSC